MKGNSRSMTPKAAAFLPGARLEGKGPITSDNPEAGDLLRQRIARLEADQERMKKANSIHKAFLKNPEMLDTCGLSEQEKAVVRNYIPRYAWEPHPFAPYILTNNAGNIRRLKQRLAALEKSEAKVGLGNGHAQAGIALNGGQLLLAFV
ncbi:MAG TPA: hypothetical protein VIS99_12845 [Terrimicrobiaceae bacterium]